MQPTMLDFNQVPPTGNQTRHISMSANIETMRDAMMRLGLEPPTDFIGDGQLRRYKGGQDKEAKNWYVLFDYGDFQAGSFGRWKGPDNCAVKWCSSAPSELAVEQRQQWKRKQEEAHRQGEEDRRKIHAVCSSWSAKIFPTLPEAPEDFPYLSRKRVKPHGTRLYKDSLVIPVYKEGRTISGLQFIQPNGSKTLKTGTDKKGGYYIIGSDSEQPAKLVICEGFATGASIHEATGLPVAVSFDAGNLLPVAEVIRGLLPNAEIVIAADDDAFDKKDGSLKDAAMNTGIVEATKAAQKIKGTVVIPIFPEPRTKDQGSDFNDMALLSGVETVRELISSAFILPPKNIFISGDELLAGEIRVDYVVDHIFEANSTGLTFGPSGSGKSFIAIDQALCIATGREWNGKCVKQGLVLYFAGEGREGIRRRVRAWCQHHSALSLPYFHLSRHTVTMNKTDIVDAIKEGRKFAEAMNESVRFIVIDTLARHIDGDENGTNDMKVFINTADAIREAFPGSVALIVHHTGHSEDSKNRARGNSSLKAAMDFEIQCNKGLLTFTKVKDGETPDPIKFKIRPVKIGVDEKGDDITSCMIDYGERLKIYEEENVKISPYERMLLDLIAEHQDVNELRLAFSDKRKSENDEVSYEAIKKSFTRCLENLKTKGLITVGGDLALLKGHGDI